jgi:hypothetical protein
MEILIEHADDMVARKRRSSYLLCELTGFTLTAK